MTSPDDAAPVKPPPSFSPGAPLVVPKTRFPDQSQTSQISITSSTYQNASPAPSTPLSSAPSEKLSRSSSPNGRVSLSTPQLGRSATASPLAGQLESHDDLRSLIIRAFSPTVGIYASPDTEELVRRKGFRSGFQQLIRPFGERVGGKIVIRDSVGAGRGWDDYGVKFVDLGSKVVGGRNLQAQDSKHATPFSQLEEVLEKHASSVDVSSERLTDNRPGAGVPGVTNLPPISSFYKLFLSRLLSASILTPHETFLHPVACVIAVSSRNSSPTETLRQLYAHTNQGDRRLPVWVNAEYLRYYVLVHDEDRDDIKKSIELFDTMKRHFGLHCHLLRLRSHECLPSDDDSVQLPSCEWLSPTEDLEELSEKEALIEVEIPTPYLFESDVQAIRTFVREMVAQSIVPHMENRVSIWNDQVASRRRGISGRFMSMSKRWTGFGSTSRGSSASSASSIAGSSGNYDALQGFYRPDAPEAIMRKMADYSLMLRDWKLSSATYELLRTDFGNDKAWKYHAGANEMCAISTLLNPMATTTMSKLDNIDQMLETASYSYLTRCSDPQDALRCLALGVELLKVRGGTAAEGAAKWAIRVLEFGLVNTIGQVLFTERIAACYASKIGTGNAGWGSRKRKAALWNVLAADAWLKLGKTSSAEARLAEAEEHYSSVDQTNGVYPFTEMQAFLDRLRRALKVQSLANRGIQIDEGGSSTEHLMAEETSEKLDHRSHRKSLIGAAIPMDPGPLSPIRMTLREDTLQRDDDFE